MKAKLYLKQNVDHLNEMAIISKPILVALGIGNQIMTNIGLDSHNPSPHLK